MAWFAARNHREKLILSCAVIGGLLWVGMGQWVLPAFSEASALSQQAARDRDAAAALVSQAAVLEQQVRDPDAQLKASLAQVQQRLALQEPRMQEVQKSLVAANAMPAFLQSLLNGNRSLQLVSLETLPPEAAIVPTAPAATAPAQNTAAVDSAATEPGKLYKHGFRMKLAGSYGDLVRYVKGLEDAPQRVVWGDMKLNVTTYPRVEMSLTVYTLSLDKTWLVL